MSDPKETRAAKKPKANDSAYGDPSGRHRFPLGLYKFRNNRRLAWNVRKMTGSYQYDTGAAFSGI